MAVPLVGGVIRVRILSSVDLPAPFRPMKPTTSPSSTSNETSLQGPDLLVVGLHLPPEAALRDVDDRVAERRVAGAVLADAVALRDLVADDRVAGHQIRSANWGSDRRKKSMPAMKRASVETIPSANCDALGGGVPATAQRNPVIPRTTGLR